MHYGTDSPINEITVCGETLFEMEVGNGWRISDIYFDSTVSAEKVDYVELKIIKTKDEDVMKTGIESNEEATKMMRHALNSMEAKIREAYNKGYQDGYKDGMKYCTEKIIDMINEDKES